MNCIHDKNEQEYCVRCAKADKEILCHFCKKLSDCFVVVHNKDCCQKCFKIICKYDELNDLSMTKEVAK